MVLLPHLQAGQHFARAHTTPQRKKSRKRAAERNSGELKWSFCGRLAMTT